MGHKEIHTETLTEVAQLAQVEHDAGSQIIDTILFSNVINVVIVVLFFVWLFRKYNLLALLTKKKEEILLTIKSFEDERRIKKNHLEQTKLKVQNVNQEVNKMVDEGAQVSESMAERIVKDAETESAEMQKKAHATIETEQKMASNKIMQDVTNAAFVIAEQHIKEAVDERLHEKFINEFIDNMEELKVQ